MLLRWGKEMKDETFNELDFYNFSPQHMIGCTITGVELETDEEGGQTGIILYTADGKVFCIRSDGVSDGMYWLDAEMADIAERGLSTEIEGEGDG